MILVGPLLMWLTFVVVVNAAADEQARIEAAERPCICDTDMDCALRCGGDGDPMPAGYEGEPWEN